jgi:hypothetical protein
MRRASFKNRRKYAADMLTHAVFGAFYTAIALRKQEHALTRAQLGSRMGREKTGISKLLAAPRNWQLSTISDLAEALDLRVQITLFDRLNPLRTFTSTGVTFSVPYESFPSVSTVNLNQPIGSISHASNLFLSSPQPSSETVNLNYLNPIQNVQRMPALTYSHRNIVATSIPGSA